MWPTTASRGPAPVPGTRATVEPTVSELTCAPKASAAARQARAGAVSYPDRPGAGGQRGARARVAPAAAGTGQRPPRGRDAGGRGPRRAGAGGARPRLTQRGAGSVWLATWPLDVV